MKINKEEFEEKAKNVKIVLTEENEVLIKENGEYHLLDSNSGRIIAVQEPGKEMILHHQGEDSQVKTLWINLLSYFREIDQDVMIKTIEQIPNMGDSVSFPVELLSTICMLMKHLRKGSGPEETSPEDLQKEIDELLSE